MPENPPGMVNDPNPPAFGTGTPTAALPGSAPAPGAPQPPTPALPGSGPIPKPANPNPWPVDPARVFGQVALVLQKDPSAAARLDQWAKKEMAALAAAGK